MGKFFSITNPATNESVPVEDKTIREETEDIEDIEDTICEVCELGNNEEMLLLCDNCDRGFHTSCVGMARIPYLDYWYCSVCIKEQSDHVQFLQRREIMNAREPELPQKRSRRTCRIVVEEQKKPRRSERLRN